MRQTLLLQWRPELGCFKKEAGVPFADGSVRHALGVMMDHLATAVPHPVHEHMLTYAGICPHRAVIV